MATVTESIALTLVMLPLVLEVALMNDLHFQNEVKYQISLSIAKAMLRQNVITEMEYKQIKNLLLEKHSPILGSLFA